MVEKYGFLERSIIELFLTFNWVKNEAIFMIQYRSDGPAIMASLTDAYTGRQLLYHTSL